MTVIEDQPPPVPSDRPAIIDLVVRDLFERKAVGTARYGTPLQAFNGRSALVDAYQEAMDLTAYLRQLIEEGAGAAAVRDPIGDVIRLLELIPKIVVNAREARDMTFTAAAGEMGIAASTLYRIEHGENASVKSVLVVLRWLAAQPRR